MLLFLIAGINLYLQVKIGSVIRLSIVRPMFVSYLFRLLHDLLCCLRFAATHQCLLFKWSCSVSYRCDPYSQVELNCALIERSKQQVSCFVLNENTPLFLRFSFLAFASVPFIFTFKILKCNLSSMCTRKECVLEISTCVLENCTWRFMTRVHFM